MKKLLLVFLVAFVFCATAMASDIAFYTGFPNDGWYSDAQKNTDVAYIIANAGHLFSTIQQFNDSQLAALGTWVENNTNDGELDVLWLPGTLPNVLYTLGNVQTEGSRIELFLDSGDMIINVADWFAYCSYEGGSRQATENGAGGAENILDLPGIINSADGTSLPRTAAGTTYLPSVPDPHISWRQVNISAVTAPWEVSEIFASNGTLADPIVIHNTTTDAYMVFINQSATAHTIDRGAATSEFLLNWADEQIGFDTTKARNPNPVDGAIGVSVEANGRGVLRHRPLCSYQGCRYYSPTAQSAVV